MNKIEMERSIEIAKLECKIEQYKPVLVELNNNINEFISYAESNYLNKEDREFVNEIRNDIVEMIVQVKAVEVVVLTELKDMNLYWKFERVNGNLMNMLDKLENCR